MARASTNQNPRGLGPRVGIGVPACPGTIASSAYTDRAGEHHSAQEPSQEDALEKLLAFSALHQQVHERKTTATLQAGDAQYVSAKSEFEGEQFVLDEVLQLVAERALAITGADGLVIALAENDEIVSRAVAGPVRPGIDVPIDHDSVFSGTCFRDGQIGRCDDTETDPRVNLEACRGLGARSMVAVPLRGRLGVAIGLLEAFSEKPWRFSDRDVVNLSRLAEIVVGALKPEDENRFEECAQSAATKLEPSSSLAGAVPMPIIPVVSVEAGSAAAALLKPLKVGIASPTASGIAQETPLAPEGELSALHTNTLAESAAEPAVALHESHTPIHRSGTLVWVLCIIMAASFGAAAWWKTKTAQLKSPIVRNQEISPQLSTTFEKDHATNSSAKTSASRNSPRITDIRHWATVDSSIIRIDVEDQVQYEIHRLTAPDRIYLDLHDTKLASDLAAKTIDVHDPLLKRIRVGQPAAGITRIVLVTKEHTDFSVRLEANPYQLIIELKGSREM